MIQSFLSLHACEHVEYPNRDELKFKKKTLANVFGEVNTENCLGNSSLMFWYFHFPCLLHNALVYKQCKYSLNSGSRHQCEVCGRGDFLKCPIVE